MDVSARDLTAADFSAMAGNLSAATGGAAPHQALRLMRELAGAAAPGGAEGAAAAEADGDEDGASAVLAAIEAAMALAPRDPLEGMLVAQMTAVHAAAMRCLCRAAECADHPQIEALYLREAARMLHLFQRQSETLDRRARRFGPPREDAESAAAGAGDAAAESAAGGEPPDRAAARRAARKIAAILTGGETPGDAADRDTAAHADTAAFLADLHARERERSRVEGARRTEDGDPELEAAPIPDT